MQEYPHGEPRGYNRGCRCEKCVTAIRAYWKAKQRRLRSSEIPEHIHGTVNGYSNYGCRCDQCLAAWQTTYEYHRKYREEHREELRKRRERYYREVQKPRREAEEQARRKRLNGK